MIERLSAVYPVVIPSLSCRRSESFLSDWGRYPVVDWSRSCRDGGILSSWGSRRKPRILSDWGRRQEIHVFAANSSCRPGGTPGPRDFLPILSDWGRRPKGRAFPPFPSCRIGGGAEVVKVRIMMRNTFLSWPGPNKSRHRRAAEHADRLGRRLSMLSGRIARSRPGCLASHPRRLPRTSVRPMSIPPFWSVSHPGQITCYKIRLTHVVPTPRIGTLAPVICSK